MRWQEVLQRITGINCPVLGVQWNPPEPERDVVRRVLAYLEGRRVLFWDAKFEYPDQCEQSVLKIRDMLSNEMAAFDPDTHVRVQLEAMRRACFAFLQVGAQNQLIVQRLSQYIYPAKHREFIRALSFLRRDFGYRVAILSAAYEIDVGKNLSSIIP